jgi:hypothetical protein
MNADFVLKSIRKNPRNPRSILLPSYLCAKPSHLVRFMALPVTVPGTPVP